MPARPRCAAGIGPIVGTRQDLREVLELHAAGRTRAIAGTRRLEQADARLVFRF